ncbi:MAG TPA: glycosyltransferase family 87 protein [Ktedonobacteraceae bacterium]|nr:glycosyltransferase family 87 protein [Ktedonobacteraceae bacterium]
MSIVQTPARSRVEPGDTVPRYPWTGSLVLGALLLLSVANNLVLESVVPAQDSQVVPFVNVWLVSFVPYLAACGYVLASRPPRGRWFGVELGIILLGGLILRAMLLPIPPVLSRDSWRYLWDARVTLHGFSPYVTKPVDPAVAFLKDNVLFPNMRFRTAPTIYPPGAQAVFLLSYLLAQSNLDFLKGIFLVFDIATCLVLIVLLRRKGLDARRVLLYAWCPLPIVEFAIQGHVDVLTLTFVLLALLVASSTSMRGRVLTGMLIGLAALTKLYPILLLAVVVPDLLRSPSCHSERSEESVAPPFRILRFVQNDMMAKAQNGRIVKNHQASSYALVAACFLTIFIGYLPYLILGHGQAFGYFSTYFSEQGQNAGVVQLLIDWLGTQLHQHSQWKIPAEHVVALLLMTIVLLTVFVQRLRERMSRETATLIIFGAILSVSSHVFPWYLPILLIFVPLLLRPLRSSARWEAGKSLAILAVWYFIVTSIISYYTGTGGLFSIWDSYYNAVYLPLMVALGLAALIGIQNSFRLRRDTPHAN